MKLYFSPLSCSLATRIALYEAGAAADFIEVDRTTKMLRDGSDFRELHPLGLVPLLRLEGGEVLTENAAILQYFAEQFPDARLAPTDPLGRAELRQWLSFISTELHKVLFYPLFDPTSPEAVRAHAVGKAQVRLSWLAGKLEGRDYLLGEAFSVADAYLITALNWATVTDIRLDPWPVLKAYAKRVRARPHVARAIAEEKALYLESLAREGELQPASMRSAAGGAETATQPRS